MTQDLQHPPSREARRHVRVLAPSDEQAKEAKQYIAVVGINDYREAAWNRLGNAVSDALGTQKAFIELGFKSACEPLINEQATQPALVHLVTNKLRFLGPHDSLVLFFAGHGHSLPTTYHDGVRRTDGYLIPHEGHAPSNRTDSWIHLSNWLNQISILQAKHILVILDSCYSGIALTPLARWRGQTTLTDAAEALQRRTSRRVITSALDDQQALDDGPLRGHSLFTGCLIEALSGAVVQKTRRQYLTGSDVWHHVQQRVVDFPGSKQTPGYGAFEQHDDGDLLIMLSTPKAESEPKREPSPHAKLDQHAAQRMRGAPSISVLAAPLETAASAWASWAAQRRESTLITRCATQEEAVKDLLAQVPWTRCLPAARSRIADAAKLAPDAIDAALDARGMQERATWLANVANGSQEIALAGWLVTAFREQSDGVPSLDNAPFRGEELLQLLCKLGRFAILGYHAFASPAGIEQGIATTARLAQQLPHVSTGFAATRDTLQPALGQRHNASLSMARMGLVMLDEQSAPPSVEHRQAGTQERLYGALEQRRRTRRQFRANAQVPTYDAKQPANVAFMARTVRLVVDIDDWHITGDLAHCLRARDKEKQLQHAGFFVLRFMPEEIEGHLDAVVDEISAALISRRTAGSTWESFHDKHA